jgi:hypothetical protein
MILLSILMVNSPYIQIVGYHWASNYQGLPNGKSLAAGSRGAGKNDSREAEHSGSAFPGGVSIRDPGPLPEGAGPAYEGVILRWARGPVPATELVRTLLSCLVANSSSAISAAFAALNRVLRRSVANYRRKVQHFCPVRRNPHPL